MIIEAMAFLAVVSAVVSLAARAAEEGARRTGIATRWIWLVSLAMPPLLLVAPLWRGARAPLPMGAMPVVELPELTVGSGAAAIPDLDLWFGAVWLLASLTLTFVLARTQRTLARERAEWSTTELSGHRVYVSTDRGPAVAGVLRPWIVLPRWSLGLPEAELRLVLLHEEEHLRGRDSLLLAGALALLVLTPWNPISWWQLRRLRTAMEVDCDRRVLRRAPDRAVYGNSLLSVAARASGPSLGLAAFTEKSLSLKTRILAMTPDRSRWTPLRVALFAFLALLVGVQACAVESPVGSEAAEPSLVEVELPPVREELPTTKPDFFATELAAAPTFTPFTVAPSITNRREVVAAMQAAYPPLLKDAGIGGTVRVFFFIDASGDVASIRIDQSSGHEALDRAAMAVAGVYDFTPAMNKDEPTPVWVSFPITFQVGAEGEEARRPNR